MKNTNKHKISIKSLKSSMINFVPIHALFKNRQAVSSVVSSLILIAAVISVGMVALGYARSTSINYQTEYAQTINSDINKLKETLIFEYAHYDNSSKTLSVYILNSGTVDVTINAISINNSQVSLPNLYLLNSPAQNVTNIGKGTEVYFQLDLSSLNLQSGTYMIKLTTRSETNFAYNFLV